MKQKAGRYLMFLLLSCWVLVLSTLVYWKWFDNPIIITQDRNYAIAPVSLSAINKNGSLTLWLHVDFCQTREIIPGTVQRMITNTGKYFLSDTSSVLGIGCHDGDRPIDLPAGLVTGPHLYHFEALYRVNPIKTTTAHTGPVPFEVVP